MRGVPQADGSAIRRGQCVDRGADRDQAAAPAGLRGGEGQAGVPAPGVAPPVDRFGDTEVVEDVPGGGLAVVHRERPGWTSAAAVARAVDEDQPPGRGQGRP
jgi:hypothetical protein